MTWSTPAKRSPSLSPAKTSQSTNTTALLRSAVERQFEIIGEALNKAGAAEASLAAQIPEFHRIIGLRHRLIHGYDNVDDEILWDVVQSKLGPLKAQVDAVLRAVDEMG